METNDFKAPATRKLRLAPLQPSALPAHPALANSGSSSASVSLAAFVREVLDEALAFSDSVMPSTFQKKGSPKSSAPAAAKVQLLSSDVLKGEAWFARRSEHVDGARDGSASFAEFERGLFHDHSVHEMDYTPDVFDAFKVLDYSEGVAGVGDFGGWSDVGMERRFFLPPLLLAACFS